MSVGQHIKTLRETERWSKAELARRLTDAKKETVHRESVSRWEAGIDHPREDNIRALAKVFRRPEREFERFGVNDTGTPSAAGKRFVPLLNWLELKHVTAEGKVLKHGLKRLRQLEVVASVPERAFAVTIQDDSMAPRFVPGEEVIIDPQVKPRYDDPQDPDFVLVRLKAGQVVFREYRPRPHTTEAYDLIGYHSDCRTESVTPKCRAELLGTMIEHRRKRRAR